MDIPVKLVGESPSVIEGGILVHKRRTLSVLALPKNMPSHIDVDISELIFHHSVKVKDVEEDNFEILDTKIASIAVVEQPRALLVEVEEEEDEEGLEGEEGGEPEVIKKGKTDEEGAEEASSEE